MNTTRPSTRILLLGCLAALLGSFLLTSLWDLTASTDFGEPDFKIYWSAAYLIREGKNPYDLELIKSVQEAQLHSEREITTIAWNPPFLFTFLLPFAWMSFVSAKFAWLVTTLLLVITAGLMLTQIYMKEVPPGGKLAFLIFAIAFPPVVTGLYMGQVTFLVFWGLVTSLYLIKKEQWFWAGAVLILTTIKPHMVVLPVLYLWIYMARQRKFQGWVGAVVAGLACLAILLVLSPDLITNPIGETSVASGRWATSTIGGLLSYLGITELARYLIILLLPLPFYLAAHPEKASVEHSVALLTLITVPFTIYGWSYDQTILLIPIAQVFSWLTRSRHRWVILTGIALAILLHYFQRILPFHEVYYVWVPLFWLFIFGLTWRSAEPLAERPAQRSMLR